MLYGYEKYAIVCIYDDKVIGFCGAWAIDLDLKIIEVSFVVKKDYQSQGIGTMLLKKVEWDAVHEPSSSGFYHKSYITAKHYKDNIASHKAFLKAGYSVCEDCNEHIPSKKDNDVDWKIKEIG